MDERRNNMDGALFVDEERRGGERERSRRRSRDDDGKAEDARRVTQGILDRMDLDATARIREDDETVVIDIEGPDAGRAIGKKGMTLEALQFLVNKIVNRDPDERRHIVLDSGDYRERHDNSLVSMAKREAKRAVSSGRAITLEPMSARDRRVIHLSLAKFPGVSTRSEGEGADRRLQIIPVREGERSRDERERGRDERSRDRRGPREGGRHERARRSGSDDRPRERADDRSRERPVADDRPRERHTETRARERESDRSRERPIADDRGRARYDDDRRERPLADDWDDRRPSDRDYDER